MYVRVYWGGSTEHTIVLPSWGEGEIQVWPKTDVNKRGKGKISKKEKREGENPWDQLRITNIIVFFMRVPSILLICNKLP